MRGIYGRTRWDGDFPIEECASIWLHGMSRFHPAQIKQAIAESARQYKHKPPTLPQFRELCRLFPNPEHKRLPNGKKKSSPAEQKQHVLDLLQLFAMKKDRAMTAAQREQHLKTLGMDQDRPAPCIHGSRSCAIDGCSKAGTMSRTGKSWYCNEHVFV